MVPFKRLLLFYTSSFLLIGLPLYSVEESSDLCDESITEYNESIAPELDPSELMFLPHQAVVSAGSLPSNNKIVVHLAAPQPNGRVEELEQKIKELEGANKDLKSKGKKKPFPVRIAIRFGKFSLKVGAVAGVVTAVLLKDSLFFVPRKVDAKEQQNKKWDDFFQARFDQAYLQANKKGSTWGAVNLWADGVRIPVLGYPAAKASYQTEATTSSWLAVEKVVKPIKKQLSSKVRDQFLISAKFFIDYHFFKIVSGADSLISFVNRVIGTVLTLDQNYQYMNKDIFAKIKLNNIDRTRELFRDSKSSVLLPQGGKHDNLVIVTDKLREYLKALLNDFCTQHESLKELKSKIADLQRALDQIKSLSEVFEKVSGKVPTFVSSFINKFK